MPTVTASDLGLPPDVVVALRALSHRDGHRPDPLCPCCSRRVVPAGADWCKPCTEERATRPKAPTRLVLAGRCRVCGRPSHARGLCSTHLRRRQRNGNLDAAKPVRTYRQGAP
jgi:hypothetical protein